MHVLQTLIFSFTQSVECLRDCLIMCLKHSSDVASSCTLKPVSHRHDQTGLILTVMWF